MEIPRPGAGDCTDYLIGYASQPPEGPILDTLESQVGDEEKAE